MSVGLSIQFLTGRYHATPWDHQVNEGVVEWPPSPWRILRSLVSAYYRVPEPPDRALMLQLLNQMANQPPSYALPDHTAAHTRHYMPIWKEGKATTTKVFDTFYALPGGAMSDQATIQVVWAAVQLSQAEHQLLQQLCRQVSYLGRAESWVEMQIATESQPCNATPLTDDVAKPQTERVKVLAPLTVEGLQGFQAALAGLPKPKKGKVKWKAPADILEALELDIANLHSQNWNGIPGTRWITYGLEPIQPSLRRSPSYSSVQAPTFARFALSSNVLPKLTEAVSLGERFRQGLMSWSKDEAGQADPVFTGRQPNELNEDGKGKPAAGQQHAWYLPEVNSRGEIDHVVVYAAGGFQAQAISALCKLPKVWGSEGFEVQTVLVSLGQTEHYSTERLLPGSSPLLGKSRKWQSLTPIVLPRHPKRDRRGNPKYIAGTSFQVDGPEHQALRLLRLLPHFNHTFSFDGCVEMQCPGDDAGDWLGYQRADGVLMVKTRCLSEAVGKQISGYRWQAFQRRRYHGNGKKESDRAFWLEVEFAEPQAGPISLGYAAHFGLGVFVPIGWCASR